MITTRAPDGANKHWLFSATSYYKTPSLYLDNDNDNEPPAIMKQLLSISIQVIMRRARKGWIF